MSMVFWVVTPCGLIGGYQDGGCMFLKYVSTHLQVHTASQPTRSPLTTDGQNFHLGRNQKDKAISFNGWL